MDADAAGTVFDPGFVDTVRRQLRAVGIETTVLPVRQDETEAQKTAARAKADIARVSRNAAQTRDAVAFLRALPYLPRDDAARLAHIARLPSPRRDAAALRVAERLARDAVYVAFANRVTPELLSKRLGCVVEQPVFPGLDLAALCLR